MGGRSPLYERGQGGTLYLPADAVFTHPGAQGAGVQAQKYRGSVFTLDTPPGIFEHLKDMIVFKVGKGFDAVSRYFLRDPARIKPVQHLQRAPVTHDYRPFDNAFQFPHVTGPLVFLKGIHGLF